MNSGGMVNNSCSTIGWPIQVNVGENPWDNQDGQSKDICNIGHTTQRTKTNKAYNTAQHRKLKMSNTDPNKNRGWTHGLAKGN